VFYKGNGNLKKARVLSYGVNKMGGSDGLAPGIHAEYDAINKLVTLRKRKKLESVNLLVIRLSGKNKLQSSKPCSNCIDAMKILPEKKGYKIQNIYYSDSDGNIVKTTLSNLDNEEKHFSKYYKNKNKNKTIQ
jgi:cytidine deaminase